jgi:hypothetical protein
MEALERLKALHAALRHSLERRRLLLEQSRERLRLTERALTASHRLMEGNQHDQHTPPPWTALFRARPPRIKPKADEVMLKTGGGAARRTATRARMPAVPPN